MSDVMQCYLEQVNWNRNNVFPTGWRHRTYGLRHIMTSHNEDVSQEQMVLDCAI